MLWPIHVSRDIVLHSRHAPALPVVVWNLHDATADLAADPAADLSAD